MQSTEARRTRHMIVRIDRGEELPGALLRALDEAEAKSGWIEGIGMLEAAEIGIFDQRRRDYHATRRIEAPSELITLSGNVSSLGGASQVRLSATLAWETGVGLEHIGGQLVWARAYSVELHVTVFDDITLARTSDSSTGLPLLTSTAGPPVPGAASPIGAVSPLATSAGEPARVNAGRAPAGPDAPLPLVPAQRIARPQEEPEAYPDVGDAVTHFHFGECTIISSDGERIRLRQERDGRVREVSLTMLKIEASSADPETGKRTFQLLRKN